MPVGISTTVNGYIENSNAGELYTDYKSESKPSYKEGRLFYDTTDHSLAYYNDSMGVSANICRELLIRVYNDSGSDMVDGQLVYINSAVPGWPTVRLAKADAEVTSQTTLGMVTNAIPNGSYGYVCENGVVHDINTNAYTAGTQLYLSKDTAGAYTDVAPLQPNYVVVIGTVLNQGTTDGQVFVHISKKAWFPSLELVEPSASITLPTTATVFSPAGMTVVYNDGFSYDIATGVITINQSGPYSFSITFNAFPPSSNKQIYFYAEAQPAGGSWTPIVYSGKQLELPNATETQVLVTASKYFATGSKLRFYIWGSAVNVLLKTSYLDGLTNVYKPAFRLQMA